MKPKLSDNATFVLTVTTEKSDEQRRSQLRVEKMLRHMVERSKAHRFGNVPQPHSPNWMFIPPSYLQLIARLSWLRRQQLTDG